MVLEIHGGGLADLVIDGGLGDEAEDGEAVVVTVGSVGEAGFGRAAGGGIGGESVEEALGEE